jgi:hypothetical protein
MPAAGTSPAAGGARLVGIRAPPTDWGEAAAAGTGLGHILCAARHAGPAGWGSAGGDEA